MSRIKSLGGKKKAENAMIRNSDIIASDSVISIDSNVDINKYFFFKLFFLLIAAISYI